MQLLRRYMLRNGCFGMALLTAVMCIGCIGCADISHVQIKSLLRDPRRYEGRSVVISGQVIQRNSLLLRHFILRDETDEIIVLTERVLPEIGANTRVKGRVGQVFAFGNKQQVVFIEDPMSR